MGRRAARPFRLADWYMTAIVAALLAAMVLLAVLPAAAAPFLQDRAASISAPASGASVRGTVAINGSAFHPEFDRYELYYTAEPGENWIFMGEPGRSPVNNGFLGNWATTSLPDGSYSLRLRVVRRDGNYDEGFARNIVIANSAPPPTPTPVDTPVGLAPLPQPVDSVVTPTPEPTATPVSVEQPEIPTPTPRPTPTPTPESDQVATADTGDADEGGALADVLDTSSMQSSFVRGATYTAAVFLAVGAFFLLRRLLMWLWYLIAP